MLPVDLLLADAALALGHLVPLAPVIIVDIQSGRHRLHFEGEPPRARPNPSEKQPMPLPNGAPPQWRFFSPAEEALIAVASEHWQTRDELAEKSGVVRDGLASESDVKAILRNLCERGVMESEQGRGFRLRVAKPGS